MNLSDMVNMNNLTGLQTQMINCSVETEKLMSTLSSRIGIMIVLNLIAVSGVAMMFILYKKNKIRPFVKDPNKTFQIDPMDIYGSFIVLAIMSSCWLFSLWLLGVV